MIVCRKPAWSNERNQERNVSIGPAGSERSSSAGEPGASSASELFWDRARDSALRLIWRYDVAIRRAARRLGEFHDAGVGGLSFSLACSA